MIASVTKPRKVTRRSWTRGMVTPPPSARSAAPPASAPRNREPAPAARPATPLRRLPASAARWRRGPAARRRSRGPASFRAPVQQRLNPGPQRRDDDAGGQRQRTHGAPELVAVALERADPL